ncbi:MFS transporter [Saccharothrix xinjiangensis]|uniref:MFS transporter n=1 Tax=Saccharothrix xinjiangensis TaxID=204798 RepID=A0ABV9XY16_9PSEU
MPADSSAARVLATPRVLTLLAIALVSRTVVAVLPITLLVSLAQPYGYGRAAVINGTMVLVLAVLGPLRGRVLDRVGQRRALVVMGIAAMTLMSLVAVSVAARWPWWSSLLLVIAAALTSPPLNAALRTSWRRVVQGEQQLKLVHSADSVLEEIGFVLAPLAAGLALVALPPRHAYELCVAVYVLVITAYLIIAKRHGLGEKPSPATEESARPPSASRRRQRWLGPLSEPAMLMIIAPLLVMGCVFGGIGILVPAYTQHLSAMSWMGPLLAMISIGGVVGGIVYGTLRWNSDLWSKYRILAIGFALPACLLFTARPLWLLALLLVLSGLFVTPVFINAFLLVDHTIDEGMRHEANIWVGASTDVANGIIAIVIGALVAKADFNSALTVLSSCAAVGLAIALIWGYLARRGAAHDQPGTPAATGPAPQPAQSQPSHTTP